MDYFKALLVRAFADAWETAVDQKIPTLLSAGVVFAVSLYVTKHRKGLASMKEAFSDYIWYGLIPIGCGLIVFFLIFFLYVTPKRMNEEKAVAITTAEEHAKKLLDDRKSGEVSDSITLKRPYLEPTLIIDSIKEDGGVIGYRYEIQNTGKLIARDILRQHGTDEFLSADIDPVRKSELAPGGRFTVEIPTGKTTVSNVFNSFIILKYNATIEGQLHGFKSRHQFSVMRGNLKVGPVLYNRAEMDIADNEIITLKSFGAMTNAIGAMALSVPETKDDGSPNVLRFVVGSKKFEFNPIDRTVRLSSKKTDGTSFEVKQTLPQPQKDVMHRILFQWDENGIELGVNKRWVCDPPERRKQ